MAQSLYSDFVIRDEQYNEGFVETLNKNLNIFNASSRGAIRIVTKEEEGHYAKTRFFDRPTLVSRRDITSTATVADTALTQDELISVKLNRRIGPHSVSRDALKKIGSDQGEFSFLMGQQVAEQVLEAYMEAALISVESALYGQSGATVDANDSTLAHADLLTGLEKFGDQQGKIKTWVMHSAPMFDLMNANITVASGNVANMTLVDANIASFNRPIIAVDSTGLQVGGTPDYAVLGLVENAVVVTETERPFVTLDFVSGYDNMFYRFQGEFAFNVEVKGFKWDTTNGGINPTDATLGTTTNWDLAVANIKDAAGVHIQVQA